MSKQLPPPHEIAGHYDRLMKEIGGEYIHQRWGDSEIKRRHYRQTEMAIRAGLDRIRPWGDVLEIGSGPAVWTTLYLAEAASAALLDISTEMLAQAQTRIEKWDEGQHARKTRYIPGDFMEVGIQADSYDTIVSSRAFEYMSDKPAFVRKCFRSLRRGGNVLLVTKNETWRDQRHASRELKNVPKDQIPIGFAMQLDLVASDTLLEMLSNAGFVQINTYPAVIGSYHRPFMSRAGLGVADAIHRYYYCQPLARMPRLFHSLTESFLAMGHKPE
jgi:ubiquinone/menaquinone biosynthesis C-methylase UbiE